ncbi:MAG: hypothetical protein CBB87_09065 [Micavibrio sp. TMED27]|nr:hypothetical protein [Micavibrio sp.]OUT90809.1 MAG: hypothetical protein CBB87_09065 [Micavibrio sp. TMED27]|tara:strand:- start:179 stop:688 length:510 start_codon:yes stop_codon:yes gene_type:complete
MPDKQDKIQLEKLWYELVFAVDTIRLCSFPDDNAHKKQTNAGLAAYNLSKIFPKASVEFKNRDEVSLLQSDPNNSRMSVYQKDLKSALHLVATDRARKVQQYAQEKKLGYDHGHVDNYTTLPPMVKLHLKHAADRQRLRSIFGQETFSEGFINSMASEKTTQKFELRSV